MQIKVETVKKMMLTEYKTHYSAALETLRYAPEAQVEMIHIAYHIMKDRCEAASSFEELDQVLSDMGYRMSLQDWIDSY